MDQSVARWSRGRTAETMAICLLLCSLWSLASGNLPVSISFSFSAVMDWHTSGDKDSIHSFI